MRLSGNEKESTSKLRNRKPTVMKAYDDSIPNDISEEKRGFRGRSAPS